MPMDKCSNLDDTSVVQHSPSSIQQMNWLEHETETLKQDSAARIYSLCQYSFASPLRKKNINGLKKT